MKTYKPHVSSVGDIAANMMALMCYVLLLFFWSTGVVWLTIIFVAEKKSGLVRFHAMQALLLWVCRGLLGGGLPFEGLAALITQNEFYLRNPQGWEAPPEVIAYRIVIGGIILLLAILAASHAYKWESWRIPILGQLSAFFCRNLERPTYMGGDEVPADCSYGQAVLEADKNAIDFAPPPQEFAEDAAIKPVATGNVMQTGRVPQTAGITEQARVNALSQENTAEVSDNVGESADEAAETEVAAADVPVSAKEEKTSTGFFGRFKRNKAQPSAVTEDGANGQLPIEMRDDIPLYLQLEKGHAAAAKEIAEEDKKLAEEEAAVMQAFMNPLGETVQGNEAAPTEEIVNDTDNLDALVMGMADNGQISSQWVVEKVMSQVLNISEEGQPGEDGAQAEEGTAPKAEKAAEDPSRRLPLDMQDPPIPADMY